MKSTGSGSRQDTPAALLAEGFSSHAVQWATRLQSCSAEQLDMLRHAAHALSLSCGNEISVGLVDDERATYWCVNFGDANY